jgi:Na+/H+ antiporter NhaA
MAFLNPVAMTFLFVAMEIKKILTDGILNEGSEKSVPDFEHVEENVEFDDAL